MTTKRLIHLWAAVALTILGVMAVRHAHSAEFDADCEGRCLVVIAGTIKPGDGDRFSAFLAKNKVKNDAVVILSSAGGAELDGLAIGRTIKRRGMDTWVPQDETCASMCAAIWLAGKTRYVTPGARIGFHTIWYCNDSAQTRAKFTPDCKHPVRSDPGNQLMSKYYADLGLSRAAIKYLETAAPTEANWLQPAKAIEIGISYTQLDRVKEVEPARVNPASPTGLPTFEQIGKSAS